MCAKVEKVWNKTESMLYLVNRAILVIFILVNVVYFASLRKEDVKDLENNQQSQINIPLTPPVAVSVNYSNMN